MKKYFQEDSKKTFQNSKDSEVVFQITIADLKQIMLKNDKEKTNSDRNKQIQTYYCANNAITDSGFIGK